MVLLGAVLMFASIIIGMFFRCCQGMVIQMLTRVPYNYARCKCGRLIHRCEHAFGVPSTWEHFDNTHLHADGTMVEHV
jgi:hypothetical protein